MKRLLLSFALIASLGLAGAQDAPEEWFWNKPIVAVQWTGLKKANRNELDALLRNYTGKPFTSELWTEVQAKLYELDWFESIELQAVAKDAAQTQLILQFVVKEKPSVLALRVSGNSGLRTADILSAIGTKAGDIYNSTKANQDDAAVKKLYTEKGYPDAEVSHETISGDDPALLTLQFKVVEGNQVTIRRIKFSGNSTMSEKTLKGQMTLKEAALFQSGAFQEAKLEESRKAVVDYYQSKGFVDAKIIDVFKEYEKDAETKKTWLILTLALSEGRQWRYGGIQFEGNRIFSSDKLQGLVTLKQGAVLNYKKLQQDKQKIDDLYYESGYIYNQLELKETRDENNAVISFTITVTERDRAHIENLSFKGNKKTQEFVLAREVPLEAGDIFSKAKIVEGLRNLYNLQYFSAVEPEIHQGSAENLMDLVINVEEMSTADIQFGITLSGLGQPGVFPLSGFVKWNDRNLGGRGQNLQAGVTLSPTEQSIDTSFSESWLFNKRISRGISFKFSHSTASTGQDSLAPIFSSQDIPDPFTALGSGANAWNGSLSSIPAQYLMPYENWEFSLGFNLGYTLKTRIGDFGTGGGISTGLGMLNYDESKYRPYEAEFRDTNRQWLFTDRLYGRIYLNNLDYWYNPTKGYYASQRFTYTGFFPEERQHYIKSETRLDAYATLFTINLSDTWRFKWVLMAHSGFQALMAQPWEDFRVTKDWLSLDGTFTARGWRNLYGSKAVMLWENSLELRMPIVEQMLWMDLFVDAGAMKTSAGMVDMTLAAPAADPSKPSFTDLSWENFAFSMGFGFRFTIPQFPFRFYFVKRFTHDGANLSWKTPEESFDFVLSITQPLY